ncbi:MAG: four helix bundle protein [Planctomycetota bacterium]
MKTHKDLDVWKRGIIFVEQIYKTTKEFIHFLYIALGSVSEVETQVMISGKLGYIPDSTLLEEVEALRRMSLNLVKYLKSKK